MTTSTFDPCFLITTMGTPFEIIGMQTNDIIILGDDQFSALKEDKLVKTNFMAKLKEKLNLITLLLFNKCILSLNEDFIALCQKGQDKKIDVINVNSLKLGYVEQHTCGVYIVSICQPEASFNLFVAV